MSAIKAVEIQAELRQIRTMADGTVNIILNLPEYCIPQVQTMLEWLQEMVICVIELDVICASIVKDCNAEVEKGAEGNTLAVGRRRSIKRRDKQAS